MSKWMSVFWTWIEDAEEDASKLLARVIVLCVPVLLILFSFISLVSWFPILGFLLLFLAFAAIFYHAFT